MAINLANVNISLAQFNAIAAGKYNAGEVKLTSENSLEKINNHVHSTGDNKVEVSHKEVLAIKEAFVRALSQNGVAGDEIRRIRSELGLSADGSHDIALADRNIKPLSRQQIRQILDRNAAALNAAQHEVNIRTDAELHAGYRPSKQQKLASKRDATNAGLSSTRQERYAKSIAVTMSVIGGDVDFFSDEDRQLLKEEALRQKARIIERSNGNPSDEPDASFQFTPADGPTMELKLGMSERAYLKKLDDIIARLDRRRAPDNEEILVRREIRFGQCVPKGQDHRRNARPKGRSLESRGRKAPVARQGRRQQAQGARQAFRRGARTGVDDGQDRQTRLEEGFLLHE